MNSSISLEKALQTFLSAFSGVLRVSSFFYYEHVFLLESEKKKRRIKRKKHRECEPMKTYSSPPPGFPQYRALTSWKDHLGVAVNKTPARHEGGGRRLREPPLGPAPPSQPRPGSPRQRQRGQTGAGPAVVGTLLSSVRVKGEMALCQRLAVPLGTALNKTKQREEAATRQHWLLAQRFHVPPRSHRLTCRRGLGDHMTCPELQSNGIGKEKYLPLGPHG